MPYLTPSRILVAVNFEDTDWENTVRHAAARARAHDSLLHLVHVTSQPHWLTRRVMDESSLAAWNDHVYAVAREKLANATDIAGEGLTVTTEVRTGKPSVELLAAIEAFGADLVVTGLQGHSATSMVMGGTGDRILRLSPVPVYVAGPRPPRAIERILVPTGMGPGGTYALNTALEQLEESQGEVTALTMVALPSVMNAYSGDVLKLRKDIEATAQAEFDKHIANISVAEGGRPIGQKLAANLEVVPAHETIVQTARELESDLICFALGGRGLGPGQLIGRVSAYVVRTAPCALLALPDRWIAAQR